MTDKRTFRDFQDLCLAITAFLLLMIGTATDAGAQTGDDGAEEADGREATAQTGDSTSAGDEAKATIPTLDQMLRIALEHNPDIRAARGEVAVAEANLDRTRLTVVKELTAFRERWHSLRASLTEALEEQANAEQLAENNVISDSELVIVRAKATGLQLQFRELETELPFLLGASLENVNQQAATSDVDSRTDLLKDKAIPLAEQVLTLSMQSYRDGNGDLERCLTWSSRLVQLQLDTAGSDRERKSAVDGHQTRLREIRDIAQARLQAARGTMEDVLAVEFAIVEAQAMLERAGAE